MGAFPRMTPLSLVHRLDIAYFSSLFEKPNSDLNFVSLWGYMHTRCEVAHLYGNLIFKLLDYHDQNPYLSFVGRERVADTISVILDHVHKLKVKPYLRSIHEDIIGLLPSHTSDLPFSIIRDNDYDDYILDLPEISLLRGRKYSDRKREINHFTLHFPKHTLKKIDLTDVAVRAQLREIFNIWESQNSPKANSMESDAFDRILLHARKFHLEGFGLYIGDRMVSFMVTEPLNETYVMSHYAKSDYNFRFAYSMLVYLVARAYHNRGLKYINFQQDLGIHGLRTYKHLWRPVLFTKKYLISSTSV